MNKRIIVFLVFVLFFISSIQIAFAQSSLAERYPGPWIEDFHAGISRALLKNGIRDCGQYKYRDGGGNEYLVRCTSDGVHWQTYIVWVGIDEVMGPYKPEPSLDDD